MTNLFNGNKDKSADATSFAPSLKKNMHSNDIMMNFQRLPSCFRELGPRVAGMSRHVSALSEIKGQNYTPPADKNSRGSHHRDSASNYSAYLGEQFA